MVTQSRTKLRSSSDFRLQVPVDVVLKDEAFERDGDRLVEAARIEHDRLRGNRRHGRSGSLLAHRAVQPMNSATRRLNFVGFSMNMKWLPSPSSNTCKRRDPEDG